MFDEARRYKYFVDHPLSSDRIEALRRRVEAMPHYTQVDPPEAMTLHDLMKAKLDAFMDPPSKTLMNFKETDTAFKARYARAIAYYQAKETGPRAQR